jgi:hypothetical protein
MSVPRTTVRSSKSFLQTCLDLLERSVGLVAPFCGSTLRVLCYLLASAGCAAFTLEGNCEA